jgi:hypothetical protein
MTRTMERCSPGTRAHLGALKVGRVRGLRAVDGSLDHSLVRSHEALVSAQWERPISGEMTSKLGERSSLPSLDRTGMTIWPPWLGEDKEGWSNCTLGQCARWDCSVRKSRMFLLISLEDIGSSSEHVRALRTPSHASRIQEPGYGVFAQRNPVPRPRNDGK